MVTANCSTFCDPHLPTANQGRGGGARKANNCFHIWRQLEAFYWSSVGRDLRGGRSCRGNQTTGRFRSSEFARAPGCVQGEFSVRLVCDPGETAPGSSRCATPCSFGGYHVPSLRRGFAPARVGKGKIPGTIVSRVPVHPTGGFRSGARLLERGPMGSGGTSCPCSRLNTCCGTGDYRGRNCTANE